MPSTSSGQTRSSRSTGKKRFNNGYYSKESRHKSLSENIEKNRSSGSKTGKSDQSHGKASNAIFSVSFRTALATPRNEKDAKKGKPNPSSRFKSSSRIDNAHESRQRSARPKGDLKMVQVPSARSRSYSPLKTSSLTANSRSSTKEIHIPNYKDVGTSSKKCELPTKHLPDPYEELTNLVNEEIKEVAERTKLSFIFCAQSLQGGTAKNATSPPLRSPPSVPLNKVRGGSINNILLASRKSRKDGVAPPEPGMNPRSPVSTCISGSRAGARSASRRHAVVSATDVREGGRSRNFNVTRSAGAGEKGLRARESPNGKDLNSKRRSARNVASTASAQMDDDDDEDETGMPQAVRLPEPTKDEPETNVEIMRRIHKGRMEKIARSVSPSDLMEHLTQTGYLRQDYNGYERTSTCNTNLKHGMKKGVERLYLWLSLYTPSDENTNSSKSN